MGEIAEMTLHGFLDEETGKVIDGEAPGYPRRASDRHAAPSGPPRQHERSVPCPHCTRKFFSWFGLQQHQAMKGH